MCRNGDVHGYLGGRLGTCASAPRSVGATATPSISSRPIRMNRPVSAKLSASDGIATFTIRLPMPYLRLSAGTCQMMAPRVPGSHGRRQRGIETWRARSLPIVVATYGWDAAGPLCRVKAKSTCCSVKDQLLSGRFRSVPPCASALHRRHAASHGCASSSLVRLRHASLEVGACWPCRARPARKIPQPRDRKTEERLH